MMCTGLADSRLSICCTTHTSQQLLVQVFLTPEYLAISMEYAKGGDMFQYVKAKGGLQVSFGSHGVSHLMRY